MPFVAADKCMGGDRRLLVSWPATGLDLKPKLDLKLPPRLARGKPLWAGAFARSLGVTFTRDV